MSELLPITIYGVVMAIAAHMYSVKDQKTLLYKRKNIMLYVLMAIPMIAFVGLRTTYNDTSTYIDMYNALSIENGVFSVVSDCSLGDNPGFWLVNGFLKLLGFSSQSFLMFYAVITVGIYLWFIWRHTTNIWFSIFLFFTTGCYTFSLAAIKQCVAIAIALVGVDFALRKKWLPFIAFVLIAATFHPYALMFLFVPIMTYRPWSTRGYVLLFLFLIIGFSLQRMLGTIVDITTLLGEEYDAASFTGEGINPLRLVVCSVPLILSFAGQRIIAREENSDENNLIINLSILNAEIMFIGLFGTANYFARLANYFLIFQALSIPSLMRIFTKRSAQLVTGVAVICYLAYYYYANGISQPFNNYYDSISIFQYLSSLL